MKIVIFNKKFDVNSFILLFIIIIFSNNTVNAEYDYPQIPFFAIKKYVGIQDSLENPTIFTTMNVNGQGIIAQIPRGDTSLIRLIDMPLPYLLSNDDLITLIFDDINNDGMIDMVAILNHARLTYLNHGDRFKLTTHEEILAFLPINATITAKLMHNYK